MKTILKVLYIVVIGIMTVVIYFGMNSFIFSFDSVGFAVIGKIFSVL